MQRYGWSNLVYSDLSVLREDTVWRTTYLVYEHFFATDQRGYASSCGVW